MAETALPEQMRVEKQYRYKLSRGTSVRCAIFCLGLAIVYCVWAIRHDGPLTIFGFHMNTSQAPVFLWAGAGGCLFATAMATWLMVLWWRMEQRIAFTPRFLLVPKSRFSWQEIAVEYSDITGLQFRQIGKYRFLRIRHSAGNFEIGDTLLPFKTDFDDIASSLHEHIKSACLTKM